jgi:hypothetical protein
MYRKPLLIPYILGNIVTPLEGWLNVGTTAYLSPSFFLISNVNFIKSAEGRNPKKIYIQKNSTKYTKDTYATILLLLVSHSGNEPSSTHVA